MRLGGQCQIAVNILIFFAMNQRMATVAEASEFVGATKTYTAKIANSLVRGGFLKSMRGTGGGLVLARASTEISIGDVVRLFERGNRRKHYPSTTNPLGALAEEARTSFFDVLDGYSIGDLVKPDLRSPRQHPSRKHGGRPPSPGSPVMGR